jgi:WhiB family redox-sensing transcriptional regulator
LGKPPAVEIADQLRLPTFILQDEPLCAQTDPDLFFPEEKAYAKASYYIDEKAAKEICSNCPLLTDCLKYAVINHPVQGIWGGTTEPERARLVGRKRRRPW